MPTGWLILVALAGAPSAYLLPPPPPGPLATHVWPALAAAGGPALRPSSEHPGDDPGAALGFVFATLPDDATLRLHRVRAAEHLEITTDLPWRPADPALADAIALRLAFLLEAPADAGQPWVPDAPLQPPPPEPRLPPERLADLQTLRPPPPPSHTTRVPPPPGAEPPPELAHRGVVEDEAPPPEDPGTGRFRLGVESVAGLEDQSVGFAVGAVVVVAPGWRVALDLAAHPFYDFRRDGRPVGVTALRAAARGVRHLWQLGALDVGGSAGLFVAALSGAGAGLDTGTPRVGLCAGAAADLPLGGPLSLTVGADLLAAAWRSEARLGDDVLLRQGPLELRGQVLLGWAVW
ncbi:MAG: hypothetical protein R3F60_26120 [bacterium]